MPKMNLSRFLAILLIIMFFVLLGLQFIVGEATAGFWSDLINIFAMILGWGGLALAIIPFFMLIIVIKIYLTETGHEYKYSLASEFEVLPSEFRGWEQELEGLGFSRFGTYALSHDTEYNVGHKTWVYLDDSKTISAEIHLQNDGANHLGFASNFEAGFAINTFYKMIFEAENENIAVRYFMNSITAAFDYHSSQLGDLVTKHGKLQQFTRLEAFIVSPEERLKTHRSLGITMMKKFGMTTVGYGAYALLALLSYVLISSLEEYIAAWIFFPLAAIVLWIFDIASIQKIFQSVESRKSRKAAE